MAAGGRSTHSGSTAAGTSTQEHRKANFNVLLEDNNDGPTEDSQPAHDQPTNSHNHKEESLEQLMAARILSPSHEDTTDWATAASKHSAKGRPKAKQPDAGTGRHYQISSNFASTQAGAGARPPREPAPLSEETTLEFYDFPATFRTQDLKAALNGFNARHRLKWNNDTSCWFMFENSTERDRALHIVQEYVQEKSEEDCKFKVRLYDPSLYPVVVAVAAEEDKKE